MEEKQLKILEERINNAISFIENLKSREKTLVDEKEELERSNAELEETVRDQERKIEALQENQLFLKNKIETVLDKLEALAGMERHQNSIPEETKPGTEYTSATTDESETVKSSEIDDDSSSNSIKENNEQMEQSGEIIIEENLVDLKSDTTGKSSTEAESDAAGIGAEQDNGNENRNTNEITQSQSENDLFTDEENDDEKNESDAGRQESRLASEYDNPFLNT
jgi:hypothetical protein